MLQVVTVSTVSTVSLICPTKVPRHQPLSLDLPRQRLEEAEKKKDSTQKKKEKAAKKKKSKHAKVGDCG